MNANWHVRECGLVLLFYLSMVLLSSTAEGAAKVNGIWLQSAPPIRSGQSFLATFDLARTGTTPASMRVTFVLVNPSGQVHQNLGTMVYTTPAVRTVWLTANGPFYGSASGWTLAAWEDTQAGYAQSAGFSVEQSPASMQFFAVSGSDRLVVSTTASSTSDSINFTAADTIYFSFRIRNVGEATGTGYYIRIKLDGLVLQDVPLDSFSGGASSSIVTWSLSPLSPGYHLLGVELIGGNGSGDSTAQSFTVTSLVDLRPLTPASWTAPIVVTNAAGKLTESSLLTVRDELFVHIGVGNSGTGAAGAFKVRLLVDGVKRADYQLAGLTAGGTIAIVDFSLGRLTEGNHEIQMVVDPDSQVAEFNEGNNVYSKTVSIKAAKLVVERAGGQTMASGDTVDFGTATVSTSGSVSLTIRNPGTAPLEIMPSGVTLAGLNPADFSVVSMPQSPLAAGASTTISLRFSPTIRGARLASLLIDSNAGATPGTFQIALTGTAEPELDAWRRTYFPGSTATTGDGANEASPRGDGVANIMKFGTGLSPLVAAVQPGRSSLEGSETIVFEYPRTKAAVRDGLSFSVEWADSLAAPVWSVDGVTSSVVDHGDVEVVTARVPRAGVVSRFVRLSILPPAARSQ